MTPRSLWLYRAYYRTRIGTTLDITVVANIWTSRRVQIFSAEVKSCYSITLLCSSVHAAMNTSGVWNKHIGDVTVRQPHDNHDTGPYWSRSCHWGLKMPPNQPIFLVKLEKCRCRSRCRGIAERVSRPLWETHASVRQSFTPRRIHTLTTTTYPTTTDASSGWYSSVFTITAYNQLMHNRHAYLFVYICLTSKA